MAKQCGAWQPSAVPTLLPQGAALPCELTCLPRGGRACLHGLLRGMSQLTPSLALTTTTLRSCPPPMHRIHPMNDLMTAYLRAVHAAS